MKKKITCIECPQGCDIVVEYENKKILLIEGNKCAKGEAYAQEELLSPKRIITSTVKAQGLALKMIPVRTDKPVSREKCLAVMDVIRAAVVRHPVAVGDVIITQAAGLDINVVVTREVGSEDLR